MDGLWCPPAGGVDDGESAIDCAIRECLEEVGVHLIPESIELQHTLHRKTPERFVIDLFFSADFTGEPLNAEPQKCAELAWVDPQQEWPWMTYIPDVLSATAPYSESGFVEDL